MGSGPVLAYTLCCMHSETGSEGMEHIVETKGHGETVRRHLIHLVMAPKSDLREVSVASLCPPRKRVPQSSYREMVQYSASHS